MSFFLVFHPRGGRKNVKEFQHGVDKKHFEYWYECIDEENLHVELVTKIVMIPDALRKIMV